MANISEKSAARELTLQTRLLAVLVALVDAARCQSFKNITTNERSGFDVHTVGIAGDDSTLTAEQRAEIQHDATVITTLRTALDALDHVTQQLLSDARNLDQLGCYLPTSADNAVLMMLTAEAQFEHASRVYAERLAEWQSIDSLTGRIRQQCVDELTKSANWLTRADLAPDIVAYLGRHSGASATAADKLASGHPRYTRHKDACVELTVRKDEAEIERDIARMRALNARALVDAIAAAPAAFAYSDEQRANVERIVAPIRLDAVTRAADATAPQS